jgi:hypothetical protein
MVRERMRFRDLELPQISGEDLIGTWSIVRTTFPMWRNPKHSHPTLNYARVEGDPSRIEDLVIYRRHGKTKQIRGIDRQDPELSCHFTWRGRGLLAPLTSEWYVVDLDRDSGLMAIYFSETWFTPEGMDIATRSPTPNPAAIAACMARVRASASLRSHVDALVEVSSQDSRTSAGEPK